MSGRKSQRTRRARSSGERTPSRGASRRRFMQLVGTATAAPLARVFWPAAGLPALAALGAGRAAAQAPEKEETPPEVRHLLEIVKQRWGDRLDAAQLKAIERELAANVRNGGTLRGLKLQNSDEPAVIFRAELPAEPAPESEPTSEAPR